MALPEPITRKEVFLNAAAQCGGNLPEPVTREEMYLNKAATGSGSIPSEPITREEMYLEALAQGGGGGGGGGEAEIAALIQRTATTIENSEATSVGANAFYNFKTLVSCKLPNIESVESSAFYGCTALETFEAFSHPKINIGAFQNCSKLRSPIVDGVMHNYDGNEFNGCALLPAVDLKTGLFRGNSFYNCSSLHTLIIRETDRASGVPILSNINVFNGTPFASGGSGGTIYISKSAYDHLGDGTTSDYKAATNWSTLDGYGTVTWATIEGSYYETHYADGTPIAA